jgi:hypothetical protein
MKPSGNACHEHGDNTTFIVFIVPGHELSPMSALWRIRSKAYCVGYAVEGKYERLMNSNAIRKGFRVPSE